MLISEKDHLATEERYGDVQLCSEGESRRTMRPRGSKAGSLAPHAGPTDGPTLNQLARSVGALSPYGATQAQAC